MSSTDPPPPSSSDQLDPNTSTLVPPTSSSNAEDASPASHDATLPTNEGAAGTGSVSSASDGSKNGVIEAGNDEDAGPSRFTAEEKGKGRAPPTPLLQEEDQTVFDAFEKSPAVDKKEEEEQKDVSTPEQDANAPAVALAQALSGFTLQDGTPAPPRDIPDDAQDIDTPPSLPPPIIAPIPPAKDESPTSPLDGEPQRPPLAQTDRPPPVQPNREEEWLLKLIPFPPLPPPPSSPTGNIEISEPSIRIICQNLNGPCSLIALCNILILRGDIIITPPSRKTVSYSYLSTLVADYLVRTPPPTSSASLSLGSALSILPSTRYGLNLNPRFGMVDGFRSASEGGEGAGELALFARSGIPLLHGWVVDPQDEEVWDAVVVGAGDYDAALEKIVEASEIAGGELVEDDEQDEEKLVKALEKRSLWTEKQEKTVREAHLIQRFLSTSSTQLTYHGLFALSTHLAPSALTALFRNSHLSVLLRRPSTPTSSSSLSPGPQLFTLVTDSSFANEPEVVWESLEDVDGGASEFYDGALRRSSTKGGDWVGRERKKREGRGEREGREVVREEQLSPEEEVARFEANGGRPTRVVDDAELAAQLQHEEEEQAWQEEKAYRREQRRREAGRGGKEGEGGAPPPTDPRRGREQERVKKSAKEKEKEKEKKDKCVVM